MYSGTRRTRRRRRTTPPDYAVRVNLEDLLYEYKERSGVSRYVVMEKLRRYVRTSGLLDTVDEIRRITDPEHLNILIGVGMRGALWYAVIAQKAKLEGLS